METLLALTLMAVFGTLFLQAVRRHRRRRLEMLFVQLPAVALAAQRASEAVAQMGRSFVLMNDAVSRMSRAMRGDT